MFCSYEQAAVTGNVRTDMYYPKILIGYAPLLDCNTFLLGQLCPLPHCSMYHISSDSCFPFAPVAPVAPANSSFIDLPPIVLILL